MKRTSTFLVVGLTLAAVCLVSSHRLFARQSASRQPVSVPSQKVTNPAAEAAYLEQIKRVRPLIKEAQAEVDKGHYQRAENLLQQAIVLNSTSAEAWLHLADVCEKQNKQTDALKAYHELVYSNQKGWGSSINSDMVTRMKYVLALLRSNKWQEAVAVYDLAMKTSIEVDGHPLVDSGFSPNRREISRLEEVAHVVLGTQSPTWGPPSKAEQKKHLEAAVRLQPNLPMVQFVYAQKLEKDGDFVAAKAAYQKAATHADGDLKVKAQSAVQRITTLSSNGARP